MLWERFGLQSLASVFNLTNVSAPDQLEKLIQYLISELSYTQSTEDESPETTFRITNKKNTYSLINNKSNPSEDTIAKISAQQDQYKESLQERVNRIGVLTLESLIKESNLVSNLQQSELSEFFCNETYYLTYSIVCRTGFLKISP
jgi:hypothetical protein